MSDVPKKETPPVANPSPLGLMGFGMTTVLLNIHNTGVFELNGMILAMGICYGGIAQIIAGVMEFRNKNLFGATAFTSYGLFWWSLVLIWFNPFKGIADANALSMGFYLLMWCIFTFFMFIGTFKHNRATQVVFGTLTLLFLLLALHNFTGVHSIGTIAGIIGIICGASAIYNAMGQVLNNEYGKTVFPLG